MCNSVSLSVSFLSLPADTRLLSQPLYIGGHPGLMGNVADTGITSLNNFVGCMSPGELRETLPFTALPAAFLPKSDAFACGAAVGGKETLPFLALPLPFCQSMMPLLVVLQCTTSSSSR